MNPFYILAPYIYIYIDIAHRKVFFFFFFFCFLLINNIIIQQAKQRLLALQASAITAGIQYILKQHAPQHLNAYFATTWAAVLQHLLTQLNLQFKKSLRRSSILLIVVAMDQSGCIACVVREWKQYLASAHRKVIQRDSLIIHTWLRNVGATKN